MRTTRARGRNRYPQCIARGLAPTRGLQRRNSSDSGRRAPPGNVLGLRSGAGGGRVKILKVRYYVDDGFRPVCRVDTNEGPVLLNIEALKLRLVWAGFVFVGERSSAAAPRIVLPRKWAGNDSEMTLH